MEEKKYMFRDLKSNEIDVRVAQVGEGWLSLLLYKDARVDMDILDETVGPMNWKREHIRENANCIVSIWDEKKQQWISKEDTGTESNTEKEKGLASDSFKRACVNWGIGRELYTSPSIFVAEFDNEGRENYKVVKKNDKITTKTRFKVKAIEIKDKEIIHLCIENDKDKKVFVM